MQQDTPDSASAAERRMNAPRPRLVTPFGLIGLVVTVGVVLVLLYPQRFLLEQIRSGEKVDEVSLQYMRNLLATEPDNHALRLKLARDYAELGQFEKALGLLEPLYAQPKWREEAAVEQIGILEKMFWQAQPGSADRGQKLNRLRQALHENESRIFSAGALRRLADAAGQAGEEALVQRTVERLVRISPDQASLTLAARVTEETGRYLDSAGYQWRACQLLADQPRKTACILQTIRILQSGGLGRLGLQWVKQLPENEWQRPDVLYSLTRLALAANRPADADEFAAKLMEQSQESTYVPAHLDLAYAAFLGNRDLLRAFDAASIAVEHEPDSPLWRERLAQISEWTAHPEVAMAQWRWLALHQGKESAWQSWMRLAGGLFDYAAQIIGLQHMSRGKDDRYARKIVKLYEDIGQPEDALAWLKKQGDLSRHPDLLLLQAEVLAHMGRDAEAISAYKQYLGQNAASPDLAVTISGMMMRAGLYQDAFEVLKKSQVQAKPKDQSFWLNLGELAWQLKEDEETIVAYRMLSDSPDAEQFEQQRLFLALKRKNPRLAAQTAERYWLKSAHIELFMDAARTYAELNDWQEVERLYEKAQNFDDYRGNFQFVELRAEMYQHAGNYAAALQDREFLVRHYPGTSGVVESLLWLLMDAHQYEKLQYYMQKWARLIGRTPGLWDVYAAGQLALGRPDDALIVYKRIAKSHLRDDLWMLNYAATLEAAGQTDQAWKIRRRIWQQRLVRQDRNAWLDLQGNARDIEALRLLLLDEPALGQGVLWKLLREGTPALKQNSQFVELAAAWLNDRDQDDATRSWLIHRYASWLNTPLGARISDALARQDSEEASGILDREGAPPNDKMNLSYLAGRYNDAAELAFGAMDRSRRDESLYGQAAPMLLHNDHTLGAMTAFRNLYDYKEMERSISTTGQRIGGFKLDLSLHQTSRFGVNPAILSNAPNETGGEISLHQTGNSYVNTLTLKLSQSLNTQAGIVFSQIRQIGARLRMKIELAYNDVTNETPLMRLIGRRDQIALQGNYQIDGRNEWETRGELNQYHSIDQQSMGSGQTLSTTLTHHLSDAHPALQGIVNGTWSTFQPAGTVLTGRVASLVPSGQIGSAGYFMPQNVHEISTYAHVGDMTDSRLPAHDFEYMGEVGRYYDTVYGGGWRMNAGVAGRVIGADRLQVFLRYDQGAYRQGANEQYVPTLEAGVVYTLHY